MNTRPPLADAEGTQGHLYSISPVAHADGMFHGAERGKRLFKLPDLFAVDVPAAVQHVGGGLEQGVAPAAERRAGVGLWMRGASWQSLQIVLKPGTVIVDDRRRPSLSWVRGSQPRSERRRLSSA